MRTIAAGESLNYRFTAGRAGIWMYHCSTAPMSTHIAAGMHGAVVIDQKHAVNAHAAFLPGFAASSRITNSAPPPGRLWPVISPPKPLTMP